MSRVFHDHFHQQINFADERFYTKDNATFYPSVTSVLSHYPKGYGFEDWLKSVGYNSEIILQRAGEQGSKIHDAIDSFLKGNEILWTGDNYSEDEWKMITKFMEFWNTNEPEIIANEQNLVSDRYRLGGTIDLVCKLKGKIYLIDYKSSNALYKTHELQIATYAMLWNEVSDAQIEATGILWLKAAARGADKKGDKIQGAGWQLKDDFGRHYSEAFKIFEHLRAIWDEENPDAKPKNLVYPDRYKMKTVKEIA